MDFVLECFDSVLFDRMYAHLLPAFPQLEKPQTPDATYSSMRQMPTGYTYEASSHFLPTFLGPSDFTYMSQWPRSNPWRQAISLYIITSYAPLSPLSLIFC